MRIFAVVALAAAACADFSRGSPPDAAPDAAPASDGGAAAGFATVAPLLASGCKTCHVAGGQAGSTTLLFTGDAAADYAVVSRFVDTMSPTDSRLLAKMAGRGHGGGTVYADGSPEYTTILRWIQQGARP